MRLEKKFSIEGHDKQFVVNELTIQQIISLMSEQDLDNLSLVNMLEKFKDTFLPLCTNVDMDYLLSMSPSEVMIIWNHFTKVNESFFVMAQKLGLSQLIENLKQAIIEDFGRIAVASSKRAMIESSTTDIPST